MKCKYNPDVECDFDNPKQVRDDCQSFNCEPYENSKKIWYEVFADYGKKYGTKTLETFDKLPEARVFKDRLYRTMGDKKYTLGIDKWKNIDNPKSLGEVF